jgi:hypothetical protein
MYERLLARTHLSRPSDVVEVIAGEAHRIGASGVVLYLVDYDQDLLVPVPAADGEAPADPQPIDGTMLGRAYAETKILSAPVPADAEHVRLFLPLLDGTERIGAMALLLAAPGGQLPEDLLATCERYAHFAAQLIVTKSAYGDTFERVRRRRRMSVAAELVWGILPPLTFGTDDVMISGLVEPCYDIGGDAFDYAVNGSVAHLAVFDAMGHGLPAAGLTSFAMAAYRHSRVHGSSLVETYAAMHTAILDFFGGERYATALFAALDLDSGRLEWISAGHPAALLLRHGRVVKTLESPAHLPLGLPFETGVPTVTSEALEPGDSILMFTDGFPEARLPNGELFGVERLGEFVEREAAAGRPAPETLRRLCRTLLAEQRSELRDDATALLVQWRPEGTRKMLPQTVG